LLLKQEVIVDPSKTKDKSGFRFAILAAFWLVSFVGARLLLDREFLARNPIPTEARVAIALFPVPATAALLHSLIRSIRRMDELQARIQLEALAFAYPLAILLLTTLGLLQLAVDLSPDDWSYRHLWPLLVAFYAGGVALANRRYQ
jgi:hypothetical protein